MKKRNILGVALALIVLPFVSHAEGRDLTTDVNMHKLSATHPITTDGLTMGVTVSSNNPSAMEQPPAHSLTYQGITFSTSAYDALTNDSYLLKLGGSIHNHLIFDGASTDWDVAGDGFWLPGSGPLHSLDTTRTKQLSAEWDTVVGGNTQRMILWTEKNKTTHLGVSTYIGTGAEPDQGDNLLLTGSGHKRQAELQWGGQKGDGSLSLCTGGACYVALLPNGYLDILGSVTKNAFITDDGSLIFGAIDSDHQPALMRKKTNNVATVKFVDSNDATGKTGANLEVGAVSVQSYKRDVLPTNLPDGSSVWCEDCQLNGLSGVIVYWHASKSVWANAVNTVVK